MLSKTYSCSLFLLSALLYAFNGIGQSTFNKYFPFDQSTRPVDIIKNKDSTYTLIAAFINSVNGASGLVMTNFDKVGNKLLEKSYLGGNTDPGYYPYLKNKLSIKVNDHSFLLTAACGDTINNTTGFLIAKINAQTLDTAWIKFYTIPIYDLRMNNIVKLNDNRYWLIGNKFDNNNTSYPTRPVIYQIDTLGNIYFSKELSSLLNNTQYTTTYDTIQQRLYTAGITNSQQSFVACVDTTGNVIWNQQNVGGCFFFQVDKKNNYIVLSGAKTGVTNDRLSLLKLSSATGSVVWQKTYWDEGLANVLNGFIINNDESIVACGSHINPELNVGLNFNGVILKVNSNGDSLWLKSYSNYLGDVEEGFIDIQQSFDGGYMMAGAPFFAPNYPSWVVKTDSLGNGPGVVVPSTITAIADFTRENTLSLYPNPTSSQVILQADIEDLNNGPVKLMICNAAGELLKEEEGLTFKDKRTTLKTCDLQNGIYFLKLQYGNKIFVNKLVIVK